MVIGVYGEVHDERYLLVKVYAALASRNADVAKMSSTTDNRHRANIVYQPSVEFTKEVVFHSSSHRLPEGQFWEHNPNCLSCQENEDAYNALYVFGRNYIRFF